MSKNNQSELKDIENKLEHMGIKIETLNREQDKLQARSKKLQTVLTDQDTSQKEIDTIVQNYESKSDSNSFETDQIESEYNGWKTQIDLTEKKPVCDERENLDEYIQFLGNKVNSLEGVKSDALFTWEDIPSSEDKLPDKIKNFLIWNFDVNLEEWINDEHVKIVRLANKITISDQNNSKKIIFELLNSNVTVTLDDSRTGQFIAKNNGQNHDIYFKSLIDIENEYKTALQNKTDKAEQFTKLKDKQKLIDDLVKKCKESIKSIEDESKKGKDKNNAHMIFYLAELKRDKDKLNVEVEDNSNDFKILLDTALNELIPKMNYLGIIEVEQTMLKSELAATKTKFNEAIKNRNSKILKQFTK